MKLILFFLIGCFSICNAMEIDREMDPFEMCPICQEVMQKEWPERISACSFDSYVEHEFCAKCLFQSLNSGNSGCPLCRTKFSAGTRWHIEVAAQLSEIKDNERYSKKTIMDIITSGKDTLNVYEQYFDQELNLWENKNIDLHGQLARVIQEKKDIQQKLNNLVDVISNKPSVVKSSKKQNFFIKNAVLCTQGILIGFLLTANLLLHYENLMHRKNSGI